MRGRRREGEPTAAASAAFLFQPHLTDLDNKLNCQKKKKNRDVVKGAGKMNQIKGEVTPMARSGLFPLPYVL